MEIKRGYDRMKINDLKKRLMLPKRYRDKHLVDFIVKPELEDSVQHVMKAILARESLYIHGKVGTGKTLLACIIANERAERLNPVKFFDTTQFLIEVNPYYSGNVEESLRTRKLARRTACLVLDDLGAEKVSETSNSAIFDVINARYSDDLQTIITSNFSLKELREVYQGLQGSRIISRLEEMMTVIHM